MKKKIIAGALIIGTIVTLMYWFASSFIIPKTAGLLMPTRWKNIPLREKRLVYASYLGPSITGDLSWRDTGDTWKMVKGNYEYSLNIKYDTDSLARTVIIQYRFQNTFFNKTGNLIIDSL